MSQTSHVHPEPYVHVLITNPFSNNKFRVLFFFLFVHARNQVSPTPIEGGVCATWKSRQTELRYFLNSCI